MTLVGYTESNDLTLLHPMQFSHNSQDGFVVELEPSGGALVYSTYLGGTGSDFSVGVGLTAAGDAIVAGMVSWDGPGGFPTTPDSPRPEFKEHDTYVIRLGSGHLPAFKSIDVTRSPLTVSTPVIIQGSGFTGATSVRFGDTRSRSSFCPTPSSGPSVLTAKSQAWPTSPSPP